MSMVNKIEILFCWQSIWEILFKTIFDELIFVINKWKCVKIIININDKVLPKLVLTRYFSLKIHPYKSSSLQTSAYFFKKI